MEVFWFFVIAILTVLVIVKIFGLKNKTNEQIQKNKERNSWDIDRSVKTHPDYYNFLSKIERERNPWDIDPKAIIWCSQFLGVRDANLRKYICYTSDYYKSFRLPKRSGGYRTISAPTEELLYVQRLIYQKILSSIPIHPCAKGFRHNSSIADNAREHLGKKNILKIDIKDFFGSIWQEDVVNVFEKIGYPRNIAKVFAQLCCYKKRVPQGAATSPVLSNIVAYKMDVKLSAFANQNGLAYTRYADDMTFSGDDFNKDFTLEKVTRAIREEGFSLNLKKTKYITEKRRKIVTGVSISSGEKMTIPKAKKRELRQNIHYILTKGVEEHQKHIGSKDPAYLRRIIGYLSFWLSIEPQNVYVKSSIKQLKLLLSKT